MVSICLWVLDNGRRKARRQGVIPTLLKGDRPY